MVGTLGQRGIRVSLLYLGPLILVACTSPPRHPSEAEKERLDATCASQSYEDCLREKNIDEDTIAEMVNRRNQKRWSYAAASKQTSTPEAVTPLRSDAGAVDPVADCMSWFDVERASARMLSERTTVPGDIEQALASIHAACANEAAQRGLTNSGSLADFADGCRRRRAADYCASHATSATNHSDAEPMRPAQSPDLRGKQAQAMEKVIRWAAMNVPVTWSWNRRGFSRCTNMVDVEVPCTSTGLIKKIDFNEVTVGVNAKNNSKFPLANCFAKIQDLTPIMVTSNFNGILGRGELGPGKTLALQSPKFTGTTTLNLVAVESGALACELKWSDVAAVSAMRREELDSLFPSHSVSSSDELKVLFVHARQLAGDAADVVVVHLDGVTYGDK